MPSDQAHQEITVKEPTLSQSRLKTLDEVQK